MHVLLSISADEGLLLSVLPVIREWWLQVHLRVPRPRGAHMVHYASSAQVCGVDSRPRNPPPATQIHRQGVRAPHDLLARTGRRHSV